MINLLHLKTFLATARLRSFTRAAHELCLTQPAVSGHVAALEEELGVELLNRTGRNVTVTDAGRIVQRSAHKIFDEINAMQGEIEDLTPLKGGTILIGASKIIGVYLLPKLVTAFREIYPDIEMRISIHSAHTIAAMVLDNAFDIAFVGEGDRFSSENVGWTPIGQDTLTVIASPKYVQRHFGRKTLTIEQASREHFILSGRETASAQNLASELTALGIRLTSTMEMDEAGAIKRAVQEDAGLAVISRCAVERELEEGRLVELTIEGWAPKRSILMLWRSDRRFSKNTEAFMQFVRKNLPHSSDSGRHAHPHDSRGKALRFEDEIGSSSESGESQGN